MNHYFNTKTWQVYYINLDHRYDRRIKTERELKVNNLAFERFSAHTDSDGYLFPKLKLTDNVLPAPHIQRQAGPRERQIGEYGCAYSHYGVLQSF